MKPYIKEYYSSFKIKEKYGYVPYPNRKKMVEEFKQRIYNFIETKGEDYNYPSLYIKFRSKIKKIFKN